MFIIKITGYFTIEIINGVIGGSIRPNIQIWQGQKNKVEQIVLKLAVCVRLSKGIQETIVCTKSNASFIRF